MRDPQWGCNRLRDGSKFFDHQREGIVIRDFYGQIVDTVHVLANGNFHGASGVIAREDLGDYVLGKLRHISSNMKQPPVLGETEPRQENPESTDKE